MDGASPAAVLERLIHGVAARNWDALPPLYAEDAVVEQPLALPLPARIEGRQALADHFAAAAKLPLEMQAANVVIHHTIDPEVVIGEFDYLARLTTSGRRFRVANIFVLRVRGGLIRESRDYTDHAAFAVAFGRLDAEQLELTARVRVQDDSAA